MNIGTKVKVHDNATMWGEASAPPSTYAGCHGIVIDPTDWSGPSENGNYEVLVRFDVDPERQAPVAWFFERELEVT